MTRKYLPFFLIACSALILFNIPSQIVKAQPKQEPLEVILDSENTIGQTFFSLYDGLQAVTVYITPREAREGTLQVELLTSPNASKILTSLEVPLSQFQRADYYDFRFPAISKSSLMNFYIRFRLIGEGEIGFSVRNVSTYPEGALYLNDQPAEAHIDFQLAYQTKSKVFGIAEQALTWIWDILLGALLFVVPGWGILCIFWNGFENLSFGERLGISACLSISIYPLVFLMADWAGISIGGHLIWAWIAISFLFALFSGIRSLQRKMLYINKQWIVEHLDDFVLFFIFGLILFSRFWAIRAVPAPLGSDSIQHAAITQLIIDHGGLFQSWLPYTPYKTFTTHFGFHVLAASYHWVSGKDILQSILIAGQITNALAVLALYPLAMIVTGGKRWAGVGAVTAAGLLSTMPAYYVNWGRYPQLIGLLILPAALWFAVKAITAEEENRAACVLFSGVTLAGMFLSYYRLPFFYGTFLLAWFISWGVPKYSLKFSSWFIILRCLSFVGVLACVLAMPWIARIISGRLSNDEIHGSISNIEQVIQDYQIWKSILVYVPLPVLILGLLGIGFSIYRRNTRQLSLLVWLVLLFIIVSTALLNIPGANLMQSTAVIISIYIPFGVLSGVFLAEIGELANRNSRRYTNYMLASLVLLCGFLGLPQVSKISNPFNYGFLTRPDIIAMEWIRKNTPEDARFFVLGQTFKKTSVIGGDGGWWVSVMTGRQSNMPPQYALVLEYPNEKDYNERVVSWVNDRKNVKLNQLEGVGMLCQDQFDYLYIGEKQTYIDKNARDTFFTAEELASSPYYKLVYQHDLVSIFKLAPDACEGKPK